MLIHNGFRYRLTTGSKMGLHKSRFREGTAKKITVSRCGKQWSLPVQCEMNSAPPVHPPTSADGIDMGIRRFATLSHSTFFKPLNRFKRLASKLAKAQCKLSRHVQGSSNWKTQQSLNRSIPGRGWGEFCRTERMSIPAEAAQQTHMTHRERQTRIRHPQSVAV